MAHAFLVDDSADIPIPETEALDFGAVDLLADYVGERSADRDAEFAGREEAGA
jgi:hypothetical protein